MIQEEWFLHPNLETKLFITDLPLCRVLLEDEAHYPWIFLVPRRINIARIMDLSSEDQGQLVLEVDFAQKILWNSFSLTQINVAAIGNKTPQLHLHIIGRKEGDPAWPNTVWDHPIKKKYADEQREEILKRLQVEFKK